VAAVCHLLAYPVPGLGIAMPTLRPAGHCRRGGSGAVARGGRAAPLRLREPRRARWRRLAQPRQGAGYGRPSRFDRRGRNLRRRLSHRRIGGAAGEPFSAARAAGSLSAEFGIALGRIKEILWRARERYRRHKGPRAATRTSATAAS
jgi:hypothetical protein